ncbi:hypothetical protein [Amycolatopsis nalaikhensis]|uniref:Uncharacterized protein n=1 Tax=Amycolatopsis nalaikhensis TaxID=715472 RepID=A0ABY8XYE0_9PSEU|nr:hypothetical protein [Amycolatopsis sp. 2-2]WIV60739.1 hypothetical protein QP939_20050 [Amycolatopsis sp. 2-2]
MSSHDEHSSLLTIRTALILLCAVLSGAAIGILTGLARHSPYEGVVVGIVTMAGAIRFFHWLIK